MVWPTLGSRTAEEQNVVISATGCHLDGAVVEVDALVEQQFAVVELFVEVEPSLAERLRHRAVHLLVGPVLCGKVVGPRQQLRHFALLQLHTHTHTRLTALRPGLPG